MATGNLPADVALWIGQLAFVLDLRVAGRLLPLLLGALFAQGRRTVASWLRAGELVGSDLGRRRAMRERLRHCGLEGLAHEDPGAGDRGDESAHHEKRDPRLASPGWRRLDLIRLDRRGPWRGTRLTHLRAAASAIA